MRIALTFDDGPCDLTTRVLNVLQRSDIRATFFVMGSLIDAHRTKVYRAAQMGCEILCHAWEHYNFTDLTKQEIAGQITATNKAIAAITGYASPILRPPYGEYDEKVEKTVRKMGHSMVCWTLDSKDWKYQDAAVSYSAIMDEAKDGDVILCHDTYQSTVEAIGLAVPELIERKFEFVTISEMIRYKYGTPEPGVMYFEPE